MTPHGIERYFAGEVSAEIALMQLVLELGSAPGALRAICEYAAAHDDAAPLQALVAVAERHRAGLQGTATLVQHGLMDHASHAGRGVAGIREQFDRAVSIAPEASVALYSLGSPELLDRASEEIVDLLARDGVLGENVHVLDVGCGIGRMERALARKVASVHGIDVSSAMIEEARTRCAGAPNVTLQVCNGFDLRGVQDRSFDLVLAIDSMPYMVAVDPRLAQAMLAEMSRVLRYDGALVILNYSYRGEPARDLADITAAASRSGLQIVRAGTRDLALWDGTTYLLRRSLHQP